MINNKNNTELIYDIGRHRMSEKVVVDNLEGLIWDIIPKKNGDNYPVVMREVNCHRGIADIICATVNEKNSDYNTFKNLGLLLSQIAKANILSWMEKDSYVSEDDLSKFTGLPYSQIAEMFGCTLGAIKVRIYRAMKELKVQYLNIAGE